MSVSSVSPTSSTASSTAASSTSSSFNSGGLDKTFMTLLMAELKAQDPTAPMDTTQMVGQMVSLNQLNELISINQLLQNALGSASSPSSTQTSNG